MSRTSREQLGWIILGTVTPFSATVPFCLSKSGAKDLCEQVKRGQFLQDSQELQKSVDRTRLNRVG